MVPLYETFVAVTCPLVGAYVAFQPLVIVCPAGRVNVSDQPLMGDVPVFAMRMLAVRPVFQALVV